MLLHYLHQQLLGTPSHCTISSTIKNCIIEIDQYEDSSYKLVTRPPEQVTPSQFRHGSVPPTQVVNVRCQDLDMLIRASPAQQTSP